MFEQINALPLAQREPAGHDRNGKRHRRQRRLDVRRHVVRAFVVVRDPAHRGIVGAGHEPAEKLLQVTPYIRVCIFLHAQRTGSVLDEKSEQALVNSAAANECRDFVRDFVKTGTY